MEAAGVEDVILARRLSKSFGGTQALRDVSIAVRAGEVHGLVGENGSGKSTFIKILAGYHTPDSGDLTVNGHRLRMPADRSELRRLGLSFVHQDLGLLPALSVLENLRIGARVAPRRGWRPIGWKRERKAARALLERYRLDLSPDVTVAELAAVDRALLAIVRALEALGSAGDPDPAVDPQERRRSVLVLDEPTVFLPAADVERLFELVRDVVAGGSSVLFVSHDLEEVCSVTDRTTVLRDGRVQGTVETGGTFRDELVEMIVGHELAGVDRGSHGAAPRAGVALALRGLSGGRTSLDVSLDLHQGEVLGVTGLAGSGFEEIPYLAVGATRALAGEVVIDGRRLAAAKLTPAKSLNLGVVLLPADRQRDGSAPALTVGENVMLPVLSDYFKRGTLQHRQMRRQEAALCVEYDVRPADSSAVYASLSGGNQQKAILAKWLQTRPRILLMHEPTQGVDIGARVQIIEAVRRAAEGGAAILIASSDYEQLEGMCDRVLVVAHGRVHQEVSGAYVTKDGITEAVYASASRAEADDA